MKLLKVACYGLNGHQLLQEFKTVSRARLVAVAGMDRALAQAALPEDAAPPKFCGSLEELLREDFDLISLCSPRRIDQAQEAIRCLRAGRHVLAEKPAAFSLRTLHSLLKEAEKASCVFREMGGSELQHPFPEMKRLVDANKIGEPVQIWALKSYPYHEGRPQNPALDGGIMQAGLHAVRFSQYCCNLRVKDVKGFVTRKGNPHLSAGGGLQMAASISIEYENSSLGSITVNYLNCRQSGSWGNDQLKIFGTEGFLEALDNCRSGRLINKEGIAPLKTAGLPVEKSYFSYLVDHLLDATPMPTPLETEVGWLEDSLKIISSLYGFPS